MNDEYEIDDTEFLKEKFLKRLRELAEEIKEKDGEEESDV